MMTSGGGNAAQADGGDIRFSTDSAGASPINCEVVSWTQNANPALAKAEIWAPVGILTASDVTIYVWYSAGGGQTQPGGTVFDANFKGVYHGQDNAASTAVANSAGASGTAAANTSGTFSSSGKIQGGQNYNGSSDYFSVSSALISTGSDFTVQGWFNKTNKGAGNDNDRLIALITDANNHFQLITDATTAKYGAELTRASVATIAGTQYGAYDTGSLVHIAYTVSGSTGVFYRNGVVVAAGSVVTIGAGGTFAYNLGRRPDANSTTFFKGIWDEIRISNSARAASWIGAEYNNQNAPGSFVVAGSPAAVGGSIFSSSVLSGIGSGGRFFQNRLN
jgi:hypothetical protein